MKATPIRLAVSALLTLQTEARMVQIAEATVSVALASDGWTPKPTTPIHGWAREVNDLRRKDEGNDQVPSVLVAPDDTCGYISGRRGAAWACNNHSATCMFFPATAGRKGNIACCDSSIEDCDDMRLRCIDYKSFYSSSACDDGCLVDRFTLKCTSTQFPYCNTISFSTDIYGYWCNDQDISTAQSAATAYSGSSRSFSAIPLVNNSTTVVLANAGAPTATSPDSGDGSGGSGGGGKSHDGKGADTTSGDDKNNIGAIVGGVIGGVSGIALIGLCWWYFSRKRKRSVAIKGKAADSSTAASAHELSAESTRYEPIRQTVHEAPFETKVRYG